ncbi:FG-GAP-like repeat-containing protein [Hydrocarboniphaga sp.]|uniref:FG-GAP-like repeat-containing protein n=1 Tax=Hydrocarboniphaga sp. TaxID=2033016 RepID=UPI003D0F5F05
MREWNRAGVVACFKSIALLLCFWAGNAGAAVPAQYQNGLYDAGYDVFSGDINGDGYPDLLLKANHQFVLVDYDVLIPVLLRWRNSFVVLSNSDGTYSIQLNPSAATLSNPIWQAGTHELIFGDTDGDGSLELLIRAKAVNGISVLMATSATDGVPQLRQRLNAIDIGIDLGQSGLDVDLVKANNDGRADLLTSRAGVVETIHMATTGGSFGQPEDDGGSGSSGEVAVGSTAGAFQATPGGGASYRMPLSLPPGLGGMTPQLAIEYSSSGPDATMGLGFGVSGLSQIARCPSTIAVDASSDGVDFDTWDRFCLDGQRLLTTATYGSVNASYVTEIESFSRIKSVDGTAGNPAGWTVETKSGLKMTYGSSGTAVWSGTPGIYVWLLKRTEDSVGNSIDYEYDLYPDSYRIKQITYGGNAAAGLPATLRVNFQYKSRSGYVAGGYMYGTYFTRNYILGSIEASVNSGSQIVRSWNFIYNSPADADDPEPPGTEPPPCTGSRCAIPRPARAAARPGAVTTVGSKTMSMSRYALTSVQECAGRKSVAGTACLPTSSFVWAPAIGSGYGAVVNSSAGTYGNDKFQYVPADVNGDGYGDLAILRAADGSSTFSVFPKGGLGGSAKINSSTINDLPTGDAKWALGDFNGDGLVDAALFYDELPCGNPLYFRPGAATYTVSALVGGSLDAASGGTCSAGAGGPPGGCPPNCQRSAVTAAATPSVTQMVAGDINGDGQDDILLISNTASGFQWRKVYTTGTGWQSGSTWDLAAAGDQTGYVPYAADFNGDGKIDIMLLKAASDGVYAWTCVDLGPCTNAGKILSYNVTQYAPIIGDTNGDGYADLVFVKTSGSMAYHYALLSTGRGTFSTVQVSANLALTGSGSWRPAAADYDGDGVVDIAWFDQSSPHDVVMAAGSGNGLFTSSETLTSAFTNVPSTFYLNPADYDGDGKVDLGVFSKDSSNNATIRMARFTGASNLRVAAITGGFGAKVGIEYKPLTSTDVYADDPEATTYPGVVRRLNVPQYVVARHTTEAQDQPTRSVAYRYYGSRLDIRGRGPLGFSRTEIQDEQTGILEATTYRQDFPYIGLAKHVERKIASSGTLISSADNVYSTIAVSQGASFPYASKSTSRQYEVTSGYAGLVSTTVSTYNYNYSDYATYGNLRSSKVTVYQGDEGAATRFETATTNTFANYTSSGWYIGRLTRTDVTRTNDKGESKSRTSGFVYSTATGLLSEELVEPDRVGTYDYLRTTYGRSDGTGNITKTIVYAYAPNASGTPTLISRTTTNEFSSASPYYRRFNTKSCNALSQCATREFDAATGNVLKSTDANNLVSTLSYDSFGRAAGSSFIQSDKYIVSDVLRQWCPDRADLCFGETKGLFAVETQASSGTRSVVVYDRLEREIRRATLGPDGRWLYALTQYDALGRVSQVSVPRYDNSSQTFWVKTQYDAIGRPYQATSPAKAGEPEGRVVTTAYRGLTTVVTDPRSANTTQTLNVLGKVVSVKNDLGQELKYEYDPYDNLTKTIDPAGNAVALQYDQRGRKIAMSDPDMGNWSYAYNGLGELITQTDAKAQTVKMSYDGLGRMTKREELEGKTTWTYDTRWKGALSDAVQTSPSNAELSRKTLEYDAVGNLQKETLTVAGSVQAPTQYAYDSKNRLDVLTYPSGLILQHLYNANGALSELRQSSASGPLYWRADSWDEWGKVAQYTQGNGVVNAVYRDPAVGQVEMLQAGSGNSIQNWHYDWDANGNTTLRENLISGLSYSESSTYDKLNRVDVTTLTAAGTTTTKNADYDAIGNIAYNQGVGAYTYTATNKPHAVRGTATTNSVYDYDANGNMLSSTGDSNIRSYAWASYNLPTQVTKGSTGSAWATFVYGPSREKLRQTSYSSGLSNRTIVYLNAYSERHTTSSGDEYREHIVAPTGVVAQVSYYPSAATRTTLYVHTDKLGSVDAMSNTAGQNLALSTSSPGFGYDRWGKRRDDSGAASPSSYNFATLKGYTGHEMLDTVGLIHMGGRVYDSTIARFLSPDPNIQDPNNLQSYNRYSYVMNNPLSAIDPTGFFGIGDVFHAVGKAIDWAKDNWRLIAAVAIMVTVPGSWGLAGQMFGGFAAGLVTSGGDLKSGLIGAATAAAFFGIGSGFGALAKQGYNVDVLRVAKIAAHGVAGGISARVSGGRFNQGFLAAGFTQTFSSGIDGIRSSDFGATGRLARISAAAIVGGTASELGGGKFANGAVTGAFSRAYNDEQHAQFRDKVLSRYGDILRTGKGIDLEANIKEAAGMTLGEFWDAVKTGGKWDYKNNPEYAGLNADLLQEFGNFHFGVVANAFGFSAYVAMTGAGMYQVFFQAGGSGISLASHILSAPFTPIVDVDYLQYQVDAGATFGDLPGDSAAVLSGWRYAEGH